MKLDNWYLVPYKDGKFSVRGTVSAEGHGFSKGEIFETMIVDSVNIKGSVVTLGKPCPIERLSGPYPTLKLKEEI